MMILLQFAFGLILLVGGGELLVRSAVRLAGWLNIPPLLTGLTIVALGTSSPELIVAIEATVKGAPDIVTGGVVGSNIANILLVLGATAIIAPIRSDMRMVNRDGMFVVGASAFVCALVLSRFITPLAGGGMVLGYVLYIAYSYWSERVAMVDEDVPGAADGQDREEAAIVRKINPYMVVAMFFLGLAGLVWGAQVLVDAATTFARTLGVPETVIGLTIVAVGTSLPELTASLVAALRGYPELALGNAVGSNISNLLLVLGVAGLLGPVSVAAQIVAFDVWIMLAATIVLVPVLVSGQTLSRIEAAFFLALYVIYTYGLYAGWPAFFTAYFNIS